MIFYAHAFKTYLLHSPFDTRQKLVDKIFIVISIVFNNKWNGIWANDKNLKEGDYGYRVYSAALIRTPKLQ